MRKNFGLAVFLCFVCGYKNTVIMDINKTHKPVTENCCNLNDIDFICRYWLHIIFFVVASVISIVAGILLHKYCKCKYNRRQGTQSKDMEANLLKPPHSGANNSDNVNRASIAMPILKYKSKITAAISNISVQKNSILHNQITKLKKKDCEYDNTVIRSND